MRRPSKRVLRAVPVVVLLVGIAILAHGAVSGGTATGVSSAAAAGNASTPAPDSINLEPRINQTSVRAASIPVDAEITVIATQGFFVSDENAELTAITRRGEVVYHNATYRVYFDVDPVPGTRWTVEYIAAAQLTGEDCAAFGTHRCTRNVIERVNLSTGTVDRLYERKTPRVSATRSHDFDRINRTHIVVADIYENRVFIYDTRADHIEWQWNATRLYDRSQGGSAHDWTHVNDVEVVPDGRIMVSVRNMDEVIFIDPGQGVQESWTLGEDQNHSLLFEQHNPDYIPARRGGPSVIVGDSENNRVVEYHRENGTWNRTWQWRDARMQWPRDADRLPNGRTLVADSHGDRVMELSPDGSIVWKVHVGMPYDVERLGTGDESHGGSAIGVVRSDASESQARTPLEAGLLALKDVLPSRWVNSVLYVAPQWFRFTDVLTLGAIVLTLAVWGAGEYRWASWSITGLSRSLWRRLQARL